MAVDIDSDTLAAVLTLWQTSTDLPTLLDDPVRAGRLHADPETRQRPLPYAQATCELDRRELAGTGGAWFDWRRLTLKLWGVKADASAGLDYMTDLFNRNAVLVFPSRDVFMSFWPDRSPMLVEDPDVKDALDVWRAEVSGLVWSVRNN